MARHTVVPPLLCKILWLSNVVLAMCSLTVAVVFMTRTVSSIVIPFCFEVILINVLIENLKCLQEDASKYARSPNLEKCFTIQGVHIVFEWF